MKNKRRMLGLSATASLLSLSAILASCGKAVKQYTVTFMNGTETVTSEKVQEGSNVSVPTQLMDQADFNGWYSDSSLTTPFDFGSAIKKDITVYANWINKYTVTFNTNGGTTINDVTVREGSNVGVPATPSKDNMVFGGWYSDANLTTVFNFGTVITKDTTIFAKWVEQNASVEKVTVVINYNDGQSTKTELVKKGIEYSLTNPKRDGFVFGGWFTDEKFTTPFVNGTAVNSNLSLYAKWNQAAETITYGFGEGLTSWGDVETTVGTKEYNNNGTIQMVLAKSYSNNGITLSSNGKNRIIHDGEGNATDYSTQQAEITIVVKTKATIVVEGTWGPTDKDGKVYLKNGSNSTYTSDSYKGKSSASINFSKEVEAGTYILSSDATLTITKLSVSRAVEYVNVEYNTEHGVAPVATAIEKGDKLASLDDLVAEGFVFEGWYTTATFDEGTKFNADTAITANTTLYAKWKVYDPNDYATVTYNFGVSNQTADPTVVEKGQKLSALPTVSVTPGYRFVRWYTEDNQTFNINTPITESMVLYAEFIQQRTVTFKYDDGTVVDTLVVDDDTKISSVNIPTAKYIYGKKFIGWFNNSTQFDVANNTVTSDLVLVAKYETQAQTNNVVFMSSASYNEGLYAEFLKYDEATTYNCYVKKSTATTYTTKLDDELVRLYKSADNTYQYYRVDALGLAAGTYSLKVVPVINGTEVTEAQNVVENLEVIAHDRSGFAFVNGTSSGAYNEDGTLKSNAIVVYVSNANKDTVSVNATTSKPSVAKPTGFNNILAAMKSSKSIDKPVCIRLLGNVEDPQALDKGDILVDGVSCGLTIEGVGNDATANGWGLRIKGSSNVEVRNLAFMNCDSDEGDDLGLQQDNNHVWVHNCDFFYGAAGGDADQAKGDGALDTKISTYVTHSYNHFWDTGKSNLQGMKDETTSNCITYHHNWYDHSDSRHPRIRTCTVHIYNNYYDGNAKYGVGVTLGASAFVENNYFRDCKYPMLSSMQGSDVYGGGTTYHADYGTFSGENGGVIKSYGNVMVGTYTYVPYDCETYVNKGAVTEYDLDDSKVHYDAYEASSRDEQVPSTVTSKKGNTTYNNFDTASTMYTYTVETAEQAKNTVMKWAGRVQGGDFKWEFTYADDTDDKVNTALKAAIKAYASNLVSVQGIESNSGSGTVTPTPTPTEKTAEDVISLINALPEATAVTASNRAAITEAKAAYDALSSEEQAKVTNKAKLEACVSALDSIAVVGKISFDKSKNVVASDVTATGKVDGIKKLSDLKLKAGVTYAGTTYDIAAKFNSKTSVTFTLTKATTIKIYAIGKASSSAANGTDAALKIGNQTIEMTSATEIKEYEISLAAGSHTLTYAKSEVYVFLIVIE